MSQDTKALAPPAKKAADSSAVCSGEIGHETSQA